MGLQACQWEIRAVVLLGGGKMNKERTEIFLSLCENHCSCQNVCSPQVATTMFWSTLKCNTTSSARCWLQKILGSNFLQFQKRSFFFLLSIKSIWSQSTWKLIWGICLVYLPCGHWLMTVIDSSITYCSCTLEPSISSLQGFPTSNANQGMIILCYV